RAGADRVERLAHQVGQQGGVGNVTAAEQGAGDAHRQVAERVRHFTVEAGQRAGETVEDAFDAGELPAHLDLPGGQALGVAGRITFVMRGAFERLQVFHAGWRGQRFGLDVGQPRSGPAHRARCVRVGEARVQGRLTHTNASALAASWMVPSSAILRTVARISFWAASTSANRTGPRASMSSSRISAARCDMLVVIFSRTRGSAPRSATASLSDGMSRSTVWIARSSISARLSNTNIRSRMRVPSASSISPMLPRITSSWPESMKLRMLAATLMPPTDDDLMFWLPENCRAMTSLSSLSALGGIPSSVAM